MEKKCINCRYCKKENNSKWKYECSLDGEILGSEESIKKKDCFYFSNKFEPTLMNYFGW